MNFAGVKFGKGAGEHSAWGVGLQYWGYGSIESTDENGNTLGDFSPKDISRFRHLFPRHHRLLAWRRYPEDDLQFL